MSLASLFSLQGRVALVTGGSRGIGRMIAAGFLQQGARVYIASRKAQACVDTAAELAPLGECIALPGDVSSVEGAQALAAAFAQREPALDILVNNAGVGWGETFETFPEKGWDKDMAVNLKGPFFLTQALYGPLRAGAARQPAKVINVASIDGLSTNNNAETYAYVASKAGLLHLTRRLALRLIRDNIVVTAIAPGAFATDMNRSARDRPAEAARRIPAARLGTLEDIAGTAIYLASRAGDYIVGETIAVDGGYTHTRP